MREGPPPARRQQRARRPGGSGRLLDERTRAASTALDALTAANDRAQSSAAALSDATSALDGAVRQATSGASAYSTTLFGTTLPAVNDALDALAETSSALSGPLRPSGSSWPRPGSSSTSWTPPWTRPPQRWPRPTALRRPESELGIVYNDVLAFGTSDALSGSWARAVLTPTRSRRSWRRPPRWSPSSSIR
ncbi:MAG: hypothetical protein ACLSDQ_01510 [Adlercreutzia equolifaciens]